MSRQARREGGFTLVELLITLLVLGIVSGSMLTLFVSLVHSAVIAKRQAIALTLATNKMEALRALPYNSLNAGTVTTSTQKLDGVTYTLTTAIKYIDDAYDGCSPAINSLPANQRASVCRNYTSTSATNDSNPDDYKIADVSVTDQGGTHLAELDTQISARVAEAASTDGALVVKVIDAAGNPLSGATVTISDNTVSPAINHTFISDQFGLAIDYALTPDSGKDYVIGASESGYSSLTTIGPNGSLSPTYPNQSILSQSSSYVTLTLKPMTSASLVVEAVDTSGSPLSGAKIYAKGGYKRYSNATDSSYCYDNLATGNLTSCATSASTDTRPVTDASGLAALSNLVPGTYIFCGDTGATSCSVGGTTYYLAAAVPYGGTNAFNPITVPTYDSSSPPATTYAYGSDNYLQKVRLILASSASFPRVATMTPDDVSLSDGTASGFTFTITGVNLACSSSASSCATSVKFQQGSNTFTASCTGNTSPATQLSCSIDISAATAGMASLVISNSGGTLTLPGAPLLGGINVTP